MHVDPAQLASASGAKRAVMLAHLRQCAPCRREAAAHDPAILFALLAYTPIPEPLLADLSAEVAHRVGRDPSTIGVLAGAAAWPRRAAVAAAFVLTLLTGYATLKEPPAVPPSITRSHPRADVDVSAGSGVSQVIDLTVGDTQIVMVYNGELKL